MNESKISVRYAKALFSLAKEEQFQEQVRTDMQYLYSIFQEVPEFRFLLEDPVIKTPQKRDIINSVFKDNIKKITLNFLDLLLRNKREAYLPSISRVYISLFKKDMGIKSAVLITPLPLEEKIRDTIIVLISKKLNVKIELEERSDKNLIGGFVLRIEDQQIDASVASQLNRIKKELINS